MEAKYTLKNGEVIYAKDGDIVLCHDLHETTVDAMETVIPKLIEDGYQLVTVSQLLSRSGEEPEAGKVYRKNTQKTVALGDVATEN